jgi:Mn-dependent DtxR family transcriptional regulator
VDEIAKAVGAQSRVVKGLLTRLEKEGRVEKTREGKYKLK